MRRSGELIQWNNKGGYGFARDDEGRDYYVHVSKLTGARPRLGDRLSFEVTRGAKGRPSAVDVLIIEAAPPPPPPQLHEIARITPGSQSTKLGLRVLVATALALLLLYGIGSGHLPVWTGLLYAAMGLASALLYRFDKLYALSGSWRVSETNLHVVDFCFGIIGGLAAQELYRHKTVKPRFAGVTWGIALLHVVGLGAFDLGLLSFLG
jgi:uncharacterized membrane protein YsdA (DUF1294 family)/cold shock CspA family protein